MSIKTATKNNYDNGLVFRDNAWGEITIPTRSLASNQSDRRSMVVTPSCKMYDFVDYTSQKKEPVTEKQVKLNMEFIDLNTMQ